MPDQNDPEINRIIDEFIEALRRDTQPLLGPSSFIAGTTMTFGDPPIPSNSMGISIMTDSTSVGTYTTPGTNIGLTTTTTGISTLNDPWAWNYIPVNIGPAKESDSKLRDLHGKEANFTEIIKTVDILKQLFPEAYDSASGTIPTSNNWVITFPSYNAKEVWIEVEDGYLLMKYLLDGESRSEGRTFLKIPVDVIKNIKEHFTGVDVEKETLLLQLRIAQEELKKVQTQMANLLSTSIEANKTALEQLTKQMAALSTQIVNLTTSFDLMKRDRDTWQKKAEELEQELKTRKEALEDYIDVT